MTASVTPHRPATGSDPLTEKLTIPELALSTVHSLAHLDALGRGTNCPLTVVRGPAGTGKSDLVAAWIASDLPYGLVAWLTLDEHDNDPVQFWTSVTAALRCHGADVDEALRCPTEPGSLLLDFLESLASRLTRSRTPVILVLDHVDAIDDPRVLRQLGLLLRKASPQLRLVLTTRRPAPAVLGRRRLTITV